MNKYTDHKPTIDVTSHATDELRSSRPDWLSTCSICLNKKYLYLSRLKIFVIITACHDILRSV